MKKVATPSGSLQPWLAFAGYSLGATAWIFLTDAIVNEFVHNGNEAYRWSVLKGVVFVLASGALLFAALRRVARTQRGLEATVSERTRSLQQSQDELRASEAKLQKLLSGLPDVVWTTTREGATSYVSPNIERMIGHSAAELCAGKKTWLELVHPEDVGRVTEAFKQLFEEGRPFDVEYRLRHKNGTFVWLHDRALSVYEENGTWYADGLFSDISAHKAVEQSRSDILRTALDGYYLVNGAGMIVEVNDVYCRLSGYTREELLGKHVKELEANEAPADVEARMRRLVENGVDQFETRHHCKNGRTIDLESSVTYQDSGHFVCFMRDITQRKEQERQLRATEERFRQVVEGAPDGIFIQVGTLLRYCNPAALQLFGAQNPEQLLDTSMFDRVDPAFHGAVRERAEMVCEKHEKAALMEATYLRVDGTRFDVEVVGIPFEFEGQPGAVVFFRDITKRKHAEQKMRALEAELRQSQKIEAIGRLAGGIAHDFNNILMVISGFAELLESKVADVDGALHDLNTITKAAERGMNLTKQLLAFGRKQILRPISLELNGLVKETASMLQRVIGEDVRLEVRTSAEGAVIEADSDQLVQVLLNLGSNARDAMPRGGSLVIETEIVERIDGEGGNCVTCDREFVKVSVSDNGCGMPKEVRERIFEPFFTTKALGKGTGLGLATVYGIVKQSNGYIFVDSEPGKGTRFRMYFPRSTDEKAQAAPEAKDAPPGNERILVVEDEEMIRASICEFLRKQGYRVTEAESGESALGKVIRGGRVFDLLITDVVMPEMSGRELSAKMTAQLPEMRTLFISGYTDDEVLRHGISHASEAFLQKPFSFSTLGYKMRELLG